MLMRTNFAPLRRLTPDPDSRLGGLLGFWFCAAMAGYGIVEIGVREAGIGRLLMLVGGALWFRGQLRIGIWTSGTHLHVRYGHRNRAFAFSQVEKFAIRPDGERAAVLWIDLADGARYPTPAQLKYKRAPSGVSMTLSGLTDLLAALDECHATRPR
ncbi:hypothetical protein ACFQO7_17600 [Catellatospora aurea]|uniref:PH (Pleckstrin Homology) domain-containing protein n=1 Tax=Catellatospora aurea TaxID=1337874 RepID=A0ABW2GW83_9ACTN